MTAVMVSWIYKLKILQIGKVLGLKDTPLTCHKNIMAFAVFFAKKVLLRDYVLVCSY